MNEIARNSIHYQQSHDDPGSLSLRISITFYRAAFLTIFLQNIGSPMQKNLTPLQLEEQMET